MLLFVNNSFAIVDWQRGLGEDAVKGTDNASDTDYDVTNYLQDPLDRLLFKEIEGCTLTRTSATVITASIGSVSCSNGAGTIKRFRQNTATTTMDMTVVGVGGIDSGSAEGASTWYSLYAVADADATTFTVIAASQGTALSDVTYYRYIGSVYNDSGSDLKNFYWFGSGHTPLIMWDVPILITTTASAGVWSAATSCSAAMPSTSTLAVFGLSAQEAGGVTALWIRPNGSTGATANPGVSYAGTGIYNYGYFYGQYRCMTDSSQQIQYYGDAGDSQTGIAVQGFYINR